MGLETFEYIDDLTVTNPLGTDDQKFGDDHLRGIKSTLKNSFSGADGKLLHYSASSAPTVNDDSSAGFVVGSIWIKRDTNTHYIATSVGAGAAAWRQFAPAQASSAEMKAGTETALRAYAPADIATAISVRTKTVTLVAFAPDEAVVTGDGAAYYNVPEELNGCDIIDVQAGCITASSSGLVTVQLHNVTLAADVLSTAVTIDANEKDSSTAATQRAINTSNDHLTTGDILRVDVDGAGTGTEGLQVRVRAKVP